MKTAIALMLCGALAACSQTTSTTSTMKTAGAPKAAAQVTKGKSGKMTAEQRCAEAMRKATQAQTNAAMLGGALSMVGGFGGLGRGGAIAAQAASVGGSLMQAKAQDDAGKAMDAECMG